MLPTSGPCVWGALMPYVNILTSVCVPQVCLCAHVCAQPTAVRGPQSNLPLWSPRLLEASAPPHLLLQFSSLAQGPGASISLSGAGAAAESEGYPFALGSKGHVGVLGPTHPHTSRRPHCSAAYLLACPTWNLFSTPDLLCKVLPIGNKTQSPALCGAEGFGTCGWRSLSSLLFSPI